MASAKLLWPPHPYRAGFCITDDTDAATPESVAIVYDFLASIGLRSTKTVWMFEPEEPCGIPGLPSGISRGVTLEHPGYRGYVRRLHEQGFEISLHGASGGNNVRARTQAALERLDRECGPSRTYICHAKNAENPYWHERVAPRGPVRALLGVASRYRCSGEDPASPYFWGDLCLERGLRIRLFRTRNVNTLAENPSMPYHDPEKPYVASWFSATKRSFADCCQREALEQLRAERGLCVLYQYMHRYADLERRRVHPGFEAAATRLRSMSDIMVDTTERIMDRLQLMQGVFLATRGTALWIFNANDREVAKIQVELEGATPAQSLPSVISFEARALRVERLAAGGAARVTLDQPVRLDPAREIAIDAHGHGARRLADGPVYINAGGSAWTVDAHLTLPPATCATHFGPRPGNRPLARAGLLESYALLAGQLGTIAGEILWKGRSLSSKRFLSGETIALEDHANW